MGPTATAADGAAGDARFFGRDGPFGWAEVNAAAGIVPASSGPRLFGVAPLQAAGPGHISFLDNRRYIDQLSETRAGAVIIRSDMASAVPTGCAMLVTPEPYAAWARVASLFHPTPPVRPGIHATAVIDPSAIVDPSAEIGPLVVIGARAEIGPGCRIGPGAVIGDAVVMGPDCRVGPLASITHAVLGARVYIYPGARIGQEGFGFATTAEGFITVPQLGRVLLHDDVEVGANSAVDRGSAQDTVIGAGSRLDNMVQIGHNVRMGRCCVIVAQAGISGSTTLEDFVTVAAQAGLTGHLRVGRRARIGAQAGVMADVLGGAEVVGSPAEPVHDFFRGVVTLRKLSRKPTLRPKPVLSGADGGTIGGTIGAPGEHADE